MQIRPRPVSSIVFQLLQTGNQHARSPYMLKDIESLHNPEALPKTVKNVQHRR